MVCWEEEDYLETNNEADRSRHIFLLLKGAFEMMIVQV